MTTASVAKAIGVRMETDLVAREIIARVLVREGGVGDVGDGKGITRYGQTTTWLDTFSLPAPRSAVEAAANYAIWLRKTGLIGLCTTIDSLADAVIDWAVNSGHPPAIKELQRALGVKIDGRWGPRTQAAVDGCDRQRAAARVIAGRIRFLGALVTDNPGKHAKQAKGWSNRVAGLIEVL